MLRWFIIFAALVFVIYAFLSSPASAQTLTCTSPRVIDGDTLECAGKRVRLKDVWAKECTRYPCRDKASEWLRNNTQGRTIRCEVAYYDKYGRAVSSCSGINRRSSGAGVTRYSPYRQQQSYETPYRRQRYYRPRYY